MPEQYYAIASQAFVGGGSARLTPVVWWNPVEEQATMVMPESPAFPREQSARALEAVATHTRPVVVGDSLADAVDLVLRSIFPSAVVADKAPQRQWDFGEVELSSDLGFYEQADYVTPTLFAPVGRASQDRLRQNFSRNLANLGHIVGGGSLAKGLFWHFGLSDRALSESVDRETQQQRLVQEIQSYGNLQTDWDGDGGRAPLKKDINNAVAFLQSLQDGDIPEPMVAGDGDVGFVWETESSYLEVGFCDNGQISFFGKMPDGHKGRGDYDFAKTGVPGELCELLEKIANVSRIA